MKIIPDEMYARMQCGATRLADGSRRVIPVTAETIPLHLLDRRFRWIVMPSLICGPVVAGFYEPFLMFPIALVWVGAAWMLGSCSHCRDLDEQDDDSVSVRHDSGDL